MDSILKILLVEDNKSDAMWIQEMINEAAGKDADDVTFELVRKEFLRDASSYLTENKVDVILLDLSLPDSKSSETAKVMLEKEKNTPIIVLTGLDDESVAIKALKNGIQDYLNKNQIDSMLLVRSIKYAIERFYTLKEKERLIKELKEALENVKVLRGLLPICASCKNIRTDDGYWIQVESYLKDHSDLSFTHSICPGCTNKLYGDILTNKKIKDEKRRYARKKVSLPALVGIPGANDKTLLQSGLVTDISLCGLQISLPGINSYEMKEDRDASRISVVLALPESKRPLTIQGIPERIFRSNGETSIGVSVVDIDQEGCQILRNYLVNPIIFK